MVALSSVQMEDVGWSGGVTLRKELNLKKRIPCVEEDTVKRGERSQHRWSDPDRGRAGEVRGTQREPVLQWELHPARV